jgi:adenosylcobinamide-phosphate guanylyltransferase
VGIVALIMAGGEATRMNLTVEKPLLDVGGKPMIEYVVEALRRSADVDKILVAVTENTPQTRRMAGELECDVVLTPGNGYQSDMRYAIKSCDLHDTLVVSADLPFISTEIVNRAIRTYFSSKKSALSVMAPVETYIKLGSQPQYVFEVAGRRLVPIGINIIDGSRIDEPELEEEVLVVEFEGLALNVNTPQDLELARERYKMTETV